MGVFYKPLMVIIDNPSRAWHVGHYDILEIIQQFHHDELSKAFGTFEVTKEDDIIHIQASSNGCELDISVEEKALKPKLIIRVLNTDRSHECHAMLSTICGYIAMRLETDSNSDCDTESDDDSLPDLV